MGPALKPVIIERFALQRQCVSEREQPIGWARRHLPHPTPPSTPSTPHTLHYVAAVQLPASTSGLTGFNITESQKRQEDAEFWGCFGGETSCAHHAGTALPTLRRKTHSTPSWLLGCWPGQEGGQLPSTHTGKRLCLSKQAQNINKRHPGRCLLGLLPSERCYSICQEENKLMSVATNNTQSSDSQSEVQPMRRVKSETAEFTGNAWLLAFVPHF